ncbi:response regulator [Fibrella forsythiae]|uniref:Response regulator n=1 Tax=Fibrella forsythiae TaxID=2817061 RepID=A0ABS3JCU8_9BACT|nr:response regulator [Fibrella forsythiae]MBO0947826.1 response regulator [Fibrella forsythiae]
MKTILVIEDNREVRENIAEILTLAQYRVVQAADGKQGVELARTVVPNLILCDIMMPELDGYGVLHIISKDPTTATIPFIFLTAKANVTDFRSGMDLGADDYLTKPFDDIALLNAVELRLRKGEQTRLQQHVDGLAILLGSVREPTSEQPSTADTYPSVHYRKKQVLYAEGNFPSAIYFIRKGQVKRFQTYGSGNQYITALAGPGDFVGYLALLQQKAHNESAEMLDDAELVAVPKSDFFNLIDHNPDVANYFIRLLADDVVEREKRLIKLAYQSVRQRVAEALLMVQHKLYPLDATLTNGRLPAMSLSRETWSDLVGASTETVIRTLSDLRTEGLIDLSGGQITLLNMEKLARLRR